jgi:hypothetical protein
MAKHPKYQVEQTRDGLQYVIPGTERVTPIAVPSMQYATDGAQFVLPGSGSTPATAWETCLREHLPLSPDTCRTSGKM